MVLCEACHQGYHLWYLDKPLLRVPDGWRCPKHEGMYKKPILLMTLGTFSTLNPIIIIIMGKALCDPSFYGAVSYPVSNVDNMSTLVHESINI